MFRKLITYKPLFSNLITKTITYKFANSLVNQVAVVTGGASGIGKACARRFAKEGCSVVIADINKKEGLLVAKQLRKQCKNKNIMFQHTNIGNEKSIKKCMKKTAKRFGTVNILVNNAAQFIYGHVRGKGAGSGTFYDK